MSPGRPGGTIVVMNRNDIDDTVRDMWVTRPRRHDGDKKIAGVAAAIGRRYRIDPTLVRVAFVVAAFYGGVGIVLYLLGWLLLPADNDEVSPAEAALGRGRSTTSTTLTWVLAIALIPATIAFFSNGPSVLLSVAVAGAALFLLHRHRGALGVPGSNPVRPDVAGADPSSTVSPVSTMSTMSTGSAGSAPSVPLPGDGATTAPGAPADPSAPTRPIDAVPGAPPFPAGQAAGAQRPTDRLPGPDRQNPPAWDPLGVAPFAWDLPEPAQPEPPVRPSRRHRSAVTPVTIGLALVTAGVCAVAAMYDSYLNGPRVVALVLAVVGTGLVVGSFVRGGRGLIPIAIPLAAITWGLAAVPDANFASMGNREITPLRLADVPQRYEHGAGNIELDLTRMRLSDTDDVRTTIELGFGNMEVVVPRGADVIATCSTKLGNLECLGQNAAGPGSHVTVTNFGDDGEGVGGTFHLQLINTGTGNVELRRG